ncbi:hypothetical protein DUNSADRAFT_9986 [Dunaliella salina]|nr:hypothetical protein DUNSADRAFT_9986 [Dunaliella salina]|eukprot:KAF5833643.1 hypothetical protein DUNSADRAFT_9986 [Dunaliella salina]
MKILASTPSLSSSSSSSSSSQPHDAVATRRRSCLIPRDGLAVSSFSNGEHEVQSHQRRRKSWVPLVHRGQRLGAGDRGVHATSTLGSRSFCYSNAHDQADTPGVEIPGEQSLSPNASIALPATLQGSGATKVTAKKPAFIATHSTRSCGQDHMCIGSSSSSSHADHGPRQLKHSARASKPLSPTARERIQEGLHSGPHTESPFAQPQCQLGMVSSAISAPLPFPPETPEQPGTQVDPHSLPLFILAPPAVVHAHSPAHMGSTDVPSPPTSSHDTHYKATRSASLRSQRARQLLRMDDSVSSLSPSPSNELQGPSKCTSLGSHQTSMLNRNSLSPSPGCAPHHTASAPLVASHPLTALGCFPTPDGNPPSAPSSTSSCATTTASPPLARQPLTIAIPPTPHEQQRAHLHLREGKACGSAPAGCYMDAHAGVSSPYGSSPEAQTGGLCMRSYLRRHSSVAHGHPLHVPYRGHQGTSLCATSPKASYEQEHHLRHHQRHRHHQHEHKLQQQQQQQDVPSPNSSMLVHVGLGPPSPPSTLPPSPKASFMRTRALARHHQHPHQQPHQHSQHQHPHPPLGSPPSTSLPSFSSAKAGSRRLGDRRNSSEPMLQQVFQATSNALRHCSNSCNNGLCNHHSNNNHHQLSHSSSNSSSGSQSRMLREQHSGSRHHHHSRPPPHHHFHPLPHNHHFHLHPHHYHYLHHLHNRHGQMSAASASSSFSPVDKPNRLNPNSPDSPTS